MSLRAWFFSGLYRNFLIDFLSVLYLNDIGQTIALLGGSKQEVRRFYGLKKRVLVFATNVTCHWA